MIANFHLHFVFQVLVMCTICIVLWQIQTARQLDSLKRRRNDWLFRFRRSAMFLKLLTLCWAVIYSHNRDWAPWPPIIAFLAAFDFHVVMQIFIMRTDITRLERLMTFGGDRIAREL